MVALSPADGSRHVVRQKDADLHEASPTSQPPVKKIRLNEDEAVNTPQRRQAACQPCRLRKVKCDKQRPTCSICSASGQACEYVGDAPEKLTLESATSTLLERFEQLQQEFDGVKKLLYHQTTTNAAHGLTPEIVRSDPFITTPLPITTNKASSIEPSRDFLQIPPHRASADTVLRWEVFQDKYPVNAFIGSLFNDSSDPSKPQTVAGLVTTHSSLTPLEEEQIPSLIDRFLQHVHTKNPILDVEALVKHGRKCAEQGVGWDARSCLVLMACALGSVAKPFGRSMPPSDGIYTDSRASANAAMPSSARIFAKEIEQGDSCFTLACRRLGSLKYSMLGAQCYFFAGVYLMYTLRPLESWHYFLHASIFFQVHLKMAHGVAGDFEEVLSTPSRNVNSTSRKSKRLEQSLYWSCFKSECEFRVELPLDQSEISLGEYPDLFPSPPSPIAADYEDGNSLHDTHMHTGNRSSQHDSRSSYNAEELELRRHAVRLCNEEESWYYYLTEIALRRIGNRIVNTFFRQKRATWLNNIKPLLRMAREFEAQVSSWSAHLPPAMQHYETTSIIRAPHLSFQNDQDPNHVSRELSWAIDNRLLEMQTWLYQPFLYYLIHSSGLTTLDPSYPSDNIAGSQNRISSLLNPFSPTNNTHTGEGISIGNLDVEDVAVLKSLIVSGIECCLKTIDVRCRGHRHHGLWFDLRSIMTASLVLLAIVKSGHSAWIPGGPETLWGSSPSNTGRPDTWMSEAPPIGGKMAKVLIQFDYWAAEAPDMARYRDVLEMVVRDIRGS